MHSDENGRTFLPGSRGCFVCGEENGAGLHARSYVEDGVVKTALNARTEHCGYARVVHGGVVAAALDECMAWAAARLLKRCCITGELTVRYLKPVPPGRAMTVCAEVVKGNRRMVHVRGEVVDEGGEGYARAEGKFVPLSVAETLAVDDQMVYRGGEERVFDELRGQ